MTTTFAYGLASLTRTDPTGTSVITLDPFGRQVALDDPVTTGTWAWSYRADGQPSTVTPPNGWGNVTSSSYDAAGNLTGLATTNAAFTYTANRAGNRLTEDAQVAGDPQNGTATFTFDPLGRLTGYSLPSIRTLGATWQADINRAGLTTDGTPVATTFDAADRPTSTGFATDLDGRLTAIPARGGAAAKSLAYDALGRLVSATVAGVTRTYAYDPLDRLVTVSEGGTPVVRIRYAGQSGSVVQLLDNSWAVTRSIAVDAAGSALADWTPGGSGWRRYVTNGHGDLVATAAANGTVSASLRLDPWGVPLQAVPAGYPAFGFQGSLTDRTTTLVYARARWYDPVLATFTSEDPLAGGIADPPSRHLYAYGAGDPVDRADPEGTKWWRVATREHDLGFELKVVKSAGRWILCDLVANWSRLRLEGVLLSAGCAGIDLLDLQLAVASRVDTTFLVRTVIMKSDDPGRETDWYVTPGVKARVVKTGRVYTSFARYPSLIYQERFNALDGPFAQRGFAGELELRGRACAEASWFGWREWGPRTRRDATSRDAGFCRGYSARAMGYDDPWNGRKRWSVASRRWPLFFRWGIDPEVRGGMWR